MIKRLALGLALTIAATGAAHAKHHRHHASGVRPRAWCGWYMTQLTGIHDRSLWMARNWAHVGNATRLRAGAIIVWAHHVGKITAVAGGKVKVLSGNDGHAVKNRWRNIGHYIAIRSL